MGGRYFDGQQRGKEAACGVWGSESSRGFGTEGRRLRRTSRRAACSRQGRGCGERGRGARSPGRGRRGMAAGFPGGPGEATRRGQAWRAGPRPLASPYLPSPPLRLSVAGSASRRLSAGCQASMIGPASDAFLPPPTRCPCGSPGSLPQLHSSSAHTRFPLRRRQPQTPSGLGLGETVRGGS